MFLPLLLAAFVPVVVVDRPGDALTVDMCASSGANLRFAWDYDADGAEDQRGPCRRTIYRPDGPLRVIIWEATGQEDRGRHEETIDPATVTGGCEPGPSPLSGEVSGPGFVFAVDAITCGQQWPAPWINTTVAYLGPVPAEFTVIACADGVESYAVDVDGDGTDDIVGACVATWEVSTVGSWTVRVTRRAGSREQVDYITVLVEPAPAI